MMYSTPILFLIFNREDTAIKVFEKIRDIKPRFLYIAADGARKEKEGEAELCDQIRKKILSLIDWDCELKTLFRDKNLGCKVAVSSAIDWFFENVEMGVILEDDCLPELSFFDFCRDMLLRYKDDKSVMMITGTNYFSPETINLEGRYFFTKLYTIWGWATWRRAWQSYDVEMKEYKQMNYGDLRRMCDDYQSYIYYKLSFDSVANGTLNTWDIQWSFNCLKNSGFCVVPVVNLISNIGVSGIHASGHTENHFIKTYNLGTRSDKLIEIKQNKSYEKMFYAKKINKLSMKQIAIQVLKKIKLYKFSKAIQNVFKK